MAEIETKKKKNFRELFYGMLHNAYISFLAGTPLCILDVSPLSGKNL